MNETVSLKYILDFPLFADFLLNVLPKIHWTSFWTAAVFLSYIHRTHVNLLKPAAFSRNALAYTICRRKSLQTQSWTSLFSPLFSSCLARGSCHRRVSDLSRFWTSIFNHVSASPLEQCFHRMCNNDSQTTLGKASRICY